MVQQYKRHPLIWCGICLIVGIVLGGLCPSAPLHATATDRIDNFAICTAAVDEETEAVYFLDFLTGNLQAAVLAKQAPYKFNAFFERNIFRDLHVDPSKPPKFLLVSGRCNFRRTGGNQQISRGAVYICDVNTGAIAAYALPWNSSMYTSGRKFEGELILVDVQQFRTAAVRR
jgi:hypothetical protein